ncbi:MAG: PLDc N-terminal domain-containing protein [Desulfovibrionaceae bacterium]|jgi:cardiolipin synthase|nr:PLDc N-terminal domain-containing protein [Desulfovibrionaceae bacterium]
MTVSLLVSYLATVAVFLLAFVLMVSIVRKQQAPSTKIAWMLTILLFPLVGVPLYLLFGGRKIRRRIRRKADLRLKAEDTVPPEDAHPADRLLRTYTIPGATTGNDLALHPKGTDAYEQLVRLMASARTSLWICTFSLGRDKVADRLLDLMIDRALAGVQVRLLLDGAGSLYAKRTALRRLRQAGGRAEFFLPLLSPVRPFLANLRNHRKITVADGDTAFAGGRNMAGKYLGPEPRTTRWKDLSFTVRGPAARAFADIFRSDWEFAAGEHLDLPATPPHAHNPGAVIQVTPSGPDVPGDPLYDTLLSLCHQARHRIWAVTPYFAPDAPLFQALRLAARRGVNVRLILPQHSDHILTDLARGPHLRALQTAGAAIAFTPPPMLHAKCLLIDHSVAMIGSANLDMRSLHFNYEAMAFVYSQPEIATLETWLQDTWNTAQRGVQPVGPLRDTLEGTASLIAPLL